MGLIPFSAPFPLPFPLYPLFRSSGPDGLGVALRGLCRVLDYVGIGHLLRDFDDVRSARGF